MLLGPLGPVNTYFAPRVAARKTRRARRKAQDHSGPMAKLCNAAPAFSCATRRDETDFVQPFVIRRLAAYRERPALPCGSCLVLDEIRCHRGCEISVNRP